MALAPGFYDLPPGTLATVVTHLEMRAPAVPRPAPLPDGVTLRRVRSPGTDWYRDLYTRVGADWLWFSRLRMQRAELTAILTDPGVEIWVLEKDGRAEGLLELDFRQEGDCELAFFGLTGTLIGSGAGRFLMNQAIARAWARPITRFHVHTCTLDSPAALGFYRRSGFTPTGQQIEIATDPRLTGDLPRDAGAHIPLYED
ncbi:GNAT family N-acetyltransferase [Pseudodonghicola xiamenensis]|uniref:N-acetyltransferase n=1 Tax=Pseudodonghicola xiamenensis TaxID=337702 RepID=A0A8J3H489_9RHOB|nr:GNAT family N-acetyltransferase [Pseudodonghicola xiamenensis]GHG84908.1 N-acetyltransferase [Pseudodonghicola xiamenensis]